MITKILGITDIFAALFFFMNNYLDKGNFWFPDKIIFIFAFYLLIKGLIFLAFLDFASILDVICAIILFVSLSMIISPLIALFVIIFLLQKGFFSLISD